MTIVISQMALILVVKEDRLPHYRLAMFEDYRLPLLESVLIESISISLNTLHMQAFSMGITSYHELERFAL